MELYKRAGNFIGSNMSWIAVVCVACGVALPQVFSPVEAVVPALFALMTFQGALNNRFRDIARVLRHPGLMLMILVSTMVLMPVLAFVFGSVCFGQDPAIVCGVVLEYCVPVGVVSYLWVGMFGGNRSLGLATILVSTVLAPFTIPLTLKVLLGATIELDTGAMMLKMAFMIAIPAVLGMLVNDLSHGWGERSLSPALSPLAKMLLVLIITANSTNMADYLRHPNAMTLAVMAFILTFASAGFAWGILMPRLLKRPLDDVVASCFVTGIRNISAGAVIAAQFFPGATVFPVMMGTMFQQVLAGLMSKRLLKLGAQRG